MNRLTKSIPAALAFMFLISCNTFHINQSSIQKVLSSSKNKPNNNSNDYDIMDKDGNGNENLDINIDTNKNKEDEDTLKELILLSSTNLDNSTLSALRSEVAFAAADCDADTFSNAPRFPPVGIIRNTTFECFFMANDFESNWATLTTEYISCLRPVKKARAGEFFQEVGFIEFFRRHYPRSFEIQDSNEVHTPRPFFNT